MGSVDAVDAAGPVVLSNSAVDQAVPERFWFVFRIHSRVREPRNAVYRCHGNSSFTYFSLVSVPCKVCC